MPDISLSLIESNEFCVSRTSEIDDIASSLRREGQLAAIRVREHPTKKGKYQVVFGNRRVAAARKLGWKTITADLVEATDVETLVMAFSENVDRRDFSDYQKAQLIQRLHDVTGKNYTEVSEFIGRSPAFVSQHIAMLHLFPDNVAPQEERDEVLRALTENHARILSRITNDQQRWNMAKLVVSSNLGVRELQKISGKISKKKEGSDLRGDGLAAEEENASRARSSQKLREIVTNILMALNSKDIRPFVGTASSRHFSMFPRFASSVVDRTNVNQYLFEILRRMNGFKMDSPMYVDLHFYGNVAYVALLLPQKIPGSEGNSTMMASRATIILEREEGNWKMVHVHWSVPSPLEIGSKTSHISVKKVKNSRSDYLAKHVTSSVVVASR